jgi:hypothetical protein
MTLRTKVFLLVLALSAACATEQPVKSEPVPDWLAGLIQQLEHPPATNPPAFIARYDYHGQVVYYVAPRCCDIPSTLYDAVGTVLCAPDGGLTGAGDGRCPDFIAQKSNEKILWRPRTSLPS